MINRIIVENEERVGLFLNTKIKQGEDLLKSNNNAVKNFLKEYSKYLYSNKCELLKEFYEKTGLMLVRECIIEKNNNHQIVLYTMNKRFDSELSNDYIKRRIYTAHIIVQCFNDNVELSYKKHMYEKNVKDLELGNSIRYTLSCVCQNINSKVRAIEKYYDKNAFSRIKINDIKQFEYTMLNNICILLKNGDLYLDSKLYATNVETLWHQDSYTYYIIYKDNSLEFLTTKFHPGHRCKHKKIVCNNTILASLYKKNVHITFITDIPDECVMTTIIGIDDIYTTAHSLYLIVGERKIRVPSWYNTIITK